MVQAPQGFLPANYYCPDIGVGENDLAIPRKRHHKSQPNLKPGFEKGVKCPNQSDQSGLSNNPVLSLLQVAVVRSSHTRKCCHVLPTCYLSALCKRESNSSAPVSRSECLSSHQQVQTEPQGFLSGCPMAMGHAPPVLLGTSVRSLILGVCWCRVLGLIQR